MPCRHKSTKKSLETCLFLSVYNHNQQEARLRKQNGQCVYMVALMHVPYTLRKFIKHCHPHPPPPPPPSSQ